MQQRKRSKARTYRGGRKPAARKAAPATIDIKNSADVKKALDVLGKHPLVVVLVFANWCPHCHTFMEQWNKYKKTPNRNTPMISVEQTQMNELLPHIKQPDGAPMSVDGFPTVLLSMNREVANGSTAGSATANVGTVINDPRNEANMTSLLQNGPAVVSAEGPEDSNEANTSALNASYYSKSIRTGTGSQPLSSNVLTAIKSASNEARSASNEAHLVRESGSEELDLSNAGTFVNPPKAEKLGSQGGGGLQLEKFRKHRSLYETLKAIGDASL